MNEMGSSWNGGSSTGTKAVAGGLDVVTAPIQAPVLAVSAAYKASARKKYEKDQLLEAELTKEIEADPSIGLRDKWATKSGLHWRIFPKILLQRSGAFYSGAGGGNL